MCKTCDAVDDNIKGMYQLMAKWEELNKSMGPAYRYGILPTSLTLSLQLFYGLAEIILHYIQLFFFRLSSQIKDIKKLLDVMELALPNP